MPSLGSSSDDDDGIRWQKLHVKKEMGSLRWVRLTGLHKQNSNAMMGTSGLGPARSSLAEDEMSSDGDPPSIFSSSDDDEMSHAVSDTRMLGGGIVNSHEPPIPPVDKDPIISEVMALVHWSCRRCKLALTK